MSERSYNIQGQHKIIFNNRQASKDKISEIYNNSFSKKSQSKKVICLKYLISMNNYTFPFIPRPFILDSVLIKRNIIRFIFSNKLKESNTGLGYIIDNVLKIKLLILNSYITSTQKCLI